MIVDEARSWIGTPFHHQARQKGVGVDCAGLIIGVANQLKISDYDYHNYGREPVGGMLLSILNDHLMPIDRLESGCIVVFRFIAEPQHLGIYTSDNTIIHAYESVGKCIEHRLDEKWAMRIVAKYKYRGVE